MPTEPRQVPVGPQPDAAARRLHIHGIKEMPAGYDAEVAELFRDLRSATALTEMDLATRLGTRPDVVQALEQGALYALPPWAETCRVVNAYGALLNLDVRPLLRRIYAQLEAGIVELQPKAMPDMPVMTPPRTEISATPPAMPARRRGQIHSIFPGRRRQPQRRSRSRNRPAECGRRSLAPRRKRPGRTRNLQPHPQKAGPQAPRAASAASLARRASRSLRPRGPTRRPSGGRPTPQRGGRSPPRRSRARPKPAPPRPAAAAAAASAPAPAGAPAGRPSRNPRRCATSAPPGAASPEPEPSRSAAGRRC